MQIIIDIEDTAPLFTQIIVQIKRAVLSGNIKPGDALPSIRQLATDLDINAKTVAKAYRLLERDAIIQTKGYRGTFVHINANDNCGVDLNAWVAKNIAKTIKTLKDADVTDSEIRIAFANVMNNRTPKGD